MFSSSTEASKPRRPKMPKSKMAIGVTIAFALVLSAAALYYYKGDDLKQLMGGAASADERDERRADQGALSVGSRPAQNLEIARPRVSAPDPDPLVRPQSAS